MEPEKLSDALPAWIEQETLALLDASSTPAFPRPGTSCVGGISEVFQNKQNEALPPNQRVCFTFTDARKCIFAFLSPESFSTLAKSCENPSEWESFLLTLHDFEFVSVLRPGQPRPELALYVKKFEASGLAVHFEDRIGAVGYIMDSESIQSVWNGMALSEKYKVAPLAKQLQCPSAGVFKGEGNKQLNRIPFKDISLQEVQQKAKTLQQKRNEHEEVPEQVAEMYDNYESPGDGEQSNSSCGLGGSIDGYFEADMQTFDDE